MKSIWATIRTSLVQKVNDIRKSNKRKREQQQKNQQKCLNSSRQENDNHVSAVTNDQAKVNEK